MTRTGDYELRGLSQVELRLINGGCALPGSGCELHTTIGRLARQLWDAITS